MENSNTKELVTLEIKNIYERFKENDTKYQIQFNAAKESIGVALIAQEKQTAQALDGTKEAITKADVATDKRFSLLSEKIDGVVETISKNTGAQGIYVTHTDLAVALDKLQVSIESTLRPVVNFMNSQSGRSSGLNSGWVYLVGFIGVLSTVISIFYALSK